MVKFWCRNNKTALVLLAVNVIGTLCSYWIAVYIVKFNIMIPQYALMLFSIIYLLLQIRLRKEKRNIWVAIYILGAIAFNYSCNYVMHNVLKPHQKVRIEVLLGLKEELNGAGYNVHQSKIAIGSGGLFGKGLGNSLQKYGYVSEPQNDFIFTIICEELGFIGAFALIALFSLLVWRGIKIGQNAPDKFCALTVYGLTTKVALQTILNIAVVTNSMPNTGIALPFFSYGGTSLLMLLGEMGIILSISRYSYQKQ